MITKFLFGGTRFQRDNKERKLTIYQTRFLSFSFMHHVNIETADCDY